MSTYIRRIVSLIVILAAWSWITPQAALAVGSGGFENASLSTRSLARSNASVADAEKPDVIAFNPAGLTELEGIQTYSGVHLINSSMHYEGRGGRPDEDASETVVPIPYGYASIETPIEGLVLGAGSNSPFGLITKYSSTGNFKYIAYYNELKTIGYYLSGAYEVTPEISVGGGWTYIDIALKQVGKFNSLFLTGTAQDAPFEFDVDGKGQGWNMGILWTPTETDTFGFYYRSEVRTHLKGTMSTHDLTGVMAAVFGGPSHVTSADTDITLPASATLGYNRQINEKWDVEVDVGWTGWHSFDKNKTEFGTGTSNAILAGFSDLPRDYEDGWSVFLGSSYEINPTWTISGGYFFEDRANNKHNFSNENPDGDRNGFSVGFEYAISNWTLDFTYMGIFVSEVDIQNTVGSTNGTDIDGKYSGYINVMSTGLSCAF
jgi:long-chain fatty acid transport protein